MRRISAALVLTAVFAGCGPTGSETIELTEVQKVRSGDLEVVLLSRDGTLHLNNTVFTLEFRLSPSGRLVDVGFVKGSATMPMPGMSPISGQVSIQPTSVPGRYSGSTDLGMAGGWQLGLEWEGAAGHGSANLSPTVQ
jgi:YtkA-like